MIWASFGSDNGLLPVWCQIITWTNTDLLSIRPLGTNFSEIWIKTQNFSFVKMYLKMPSATWRPFCSGRDELMTLMIYFLDEYLVGIYLYFSKAFDTVDHVMLLKKLAYCGFRGIAWKWFDIYLSNQEECVTYNGISSSKQWIKSGVP